MSKFVVDEPLIFGLAVAALMQLMYSTVTSCPVLWYWMWKTNWGLCCATSLLDKLPAIVENDIFVLVYNPVDQYKPTTTTSPNTCIPKLDCLVW